ncbi:MAG: MotE family protein [Chitinispirillaceae bacterium]
MRAKDILAIALVAILSFPLMYGIMLFATGNARIEFGPKTVAERKEEEHKLLRQTARKDSLSIANLQSFQALQREREQLQKDLEKLREQQQRADLVSRELQRERDKLAQQKKKLEKLVNENDELELKRLKELSKVYGAMRPPEAAAILETLEDSLVIGIISGIRDDRQRGKILAALSNGKAARISRLMGSSKIRK